MLIIPFINVDNIVTKFFTKVRKKTFLISIAFFKLLTNFSKKNSDLLTKW